MIAYLLAAVAIIIAFIINWVMPLPLWRATLTSSIAVFATGRRCRTGTSSQLGTFNFTVARVLLNFDISVCWLVFACGEKIEKWGMLNMPLNLWSYPPREHKIV